ncbi:MAG TPA: class I SAM-dependent methyltransferase [Gemmatimonadales bacterium]|nr:class I SAM-dependent methyltransferase [Gemmatimonadales bacterium]
MKTRLRAFVKKHLPAAFAGYRFLKRHYQARRLRRMTVEEVFTDYFHKKRWGGQKTVSGVGSDPEQTIAVRRELPRLLSQLGVKSLLDIPCGDFTWMSGVPLDGISYTGADIVTELVEENRRRYLKPNVRFVRLDLIHDPLPRTDLVLCRDCLIHLSTEDVLGALRNIHASGSEYLLTTTFPSRDRNVDIATGQWRPLNLEQRPFCLPKPLLLINEESTEEDGEYRDKSLGLWRVDGIQPALDRQNGP